MSDPKVKVDSLVDAAGNLAVNLVRVGTTVATVPLSFLGPKVRDDTVGAVRDVFGALVKLQLSITKGAVDVAENLTKQVDKVVADTLPASK